jgi:anti-sigma factor RsiW
MNAPIPPVPVPVPEDDIHALVDGRLTRAQAAAVHKRMALDPLAEDTFAAWSEQREAILGHHADLLKESIPASFIAAADNLARAQERSAQWWRWGGMAASVALAFVCGWAGSSYWGANPGSAQLARASVHNFAEQAALAHAVYLPEVRHPVEVPAAQQDHLVQWLSKRVGRPLKVPNLSAQGYELVGGRLLPGESGARAQFMFQNAGGERVTLYLGAIKAGDAAANTKETAFRFLDDGAAPGFYWVDRGFGYALSGKLSRPALLALATEVYQQL